MTDNQCVTHPFVSAGATVTPISPSMGAVYPLGGPAPIREVRSTVALYDALTLSIEQLEYLEAVNGAIVEALDQCGAPDAATQRARVLARLARSHAGHWLALFREEAEQRHPRVRGAQAGDADDGR
ncbi:hypothetical protein [Isoalcanivorax indicus]|uniref:hypothetical protein n=1 Tax=Isoalcanivorax indicus TaxID=2202653 RepID=UPI000DBA40CE|nr:hypothetical protein [Isoalcanivorax indicus]